MGLVPDLDPAASEPQGVGCKMGHDGGDGAIFHPDIGLGLVTADHNGQGGIFEKARAVLFGLGKPREQIGLIDEYKCPGVDPPRRRTSEQGFF